MRETTAADLIWRILEDEGVRVVFGHPGGAILPIYDALYRHGGVRHVLARHEQAAAHAADGYARVTGRVGVCLATSGPGATNLVTGLATAQMDSVPLVAVTGQVSLDLMGTQAFQETDIVSVARPVTKAAYRVVDPDEMDGMLRHAVRVAREGRPGPVLVDVPKCVQRSRVRGRGLRGTRPKGRSPAPASRYDAAEGSRTPGPGGCVGRTEDAPALDAPVGRARTEDALDRAARLLATARRPVLMVGRGVILSGTCPGVRELAESLDLPVITTLLGLDAFPARDPRSLGMPGMHGTERANRAIHSADLVVGLGLRFDDRVTGAAGTFAPDATIVHFDVDPDAPGRSARADVAVVGDLRRTLPALRERVGRRIGPDGPTRRGWWEQLRRWDRECGPAANEGGGREDRLSGRTAARALCRRIEAGEGTVVTDVGQHQMWMAQELRSMRPGTHLTSGGLGTMGYALPAAMGASLARPGEAVWAVVGDGGFQMTLQELATVREERMPLRLVVMNNGFLGMVRQWQELFYEGRYSATRMTGPDLVSLAGAYGIPGRTAESETQLEAALDWADTVQGPSLLEVRVREEENVYPMVPTGASLGELVTGRPPAGSRGTGEPGRDTPAVDSEETADTTGTVWC